MKPATELIQLDQELTGEEALRRGLVPVPPEDVERVQAMTDAERLDYARGLMVRTKLEGGGELAQPVGPLMSRGLERRRKKNAKRRERQGRARPKPQLEEWRETGWVALRRPE